MSLPLNPHLTAAGRRASVCRLILCVVALIAAPAADTAASSSDDSTPTVTVAEDRGVYSVNAAFAVATPPEIVLAVLTDYSAIPRFMPQVRTSIVRERSEGRAVVEQEAIARFLMFSRRVHLLLEIHEQPSRLNFRDLCEQSFHQYEGAWELERAEESTRIRYTLTAKPSFAVPEFLLGRLLKRDAMQMIAGLHTEIARRSIAGGTTPR